MQIYRLFSRLSKLIVLVQYYSIKSLESGWLGVTCFEQDPVLFVLWLKHCCDVSAMQRLKGMRLSGCAVSKACKLGEVNRFCAGQGLYLLNICPKWRVRVGVMLPSSRPNISTELILLCIIKRTQKRLLVVSVTRPVRLLTRICFLWLQEV